MEVEAELLRVTDEKREKTISNLRRFIQTPSVAPPGDEGKLAPIIAETMENIGMRVHVKEVYPDRPNVIGILGDKEKPTLLLDGHMDVVPPGSGWTLDPFSGEIRNDKIYGRGASDMKGGLASMLAAAEALVEADVKLNGRFVLAAVSDEEVLAGGTWKMVSEGFRAEMAIIGEPTNLGICTAHKGTLGVYISTKGKSAHGSRPQEGINAIVKMSKIICELETFGAGLNQRKHPQLGNPTLSINLIKGGAKENIVPDSCEIYLDIRTIPGETEESWISEIETFLKELEKRDPQLETSVTRQKYPFKCLPLQTPAEEEVVQIMKYAVRRALRREPFLTAFDGFTDGSLLSNYAQTPTVVFGPGKISQAHTADEYVEIEQVISAAKVYALAAFKALSGKNKS